jgi:Fe-S-cluster containining protein
LAEPEVYQIAKLLEDMPEPRQREIKKKFADACEHLEKIDWFNRMENIFIESKPSKKEEIRKLALEYLAEKIACPFLENESCLIHQDRPLSCREFLVTSPAENCQNPTAENIKHVDLKFKVSDIVRELWKSENLPNTSFVTMIYALEWAEKYPENFAEKSGGEWLGEFFGSLK